MSEADVNTALPDEAHVLTPTWSTVVLSIIGLTTLSIAQPIFELVGRNPSFFVAHRSGRWDIIGFAFVVYLLPPLILIALLGAAKILPARYRRVATAVIIGGLLGYTLLGVVRRPAAWSTVALVLSVFVVGAVCGLIFPRTEAVQTLTRLIGYFSLVIVGWFLFLSPAAGLLGDDTAEAVGTGATNDTSVVMLVFDELPAASLLTSSGQIDAEKLPGFARLGDQSTWYRETATVSAQTRWAVPALASGLMPPGRNVRPDAVGYPQNLFTLLAPTHDLNASEVLTRLCPDNLCATNESVAKSLLYDDGLVVAGRTLLPAGLADRWVAPINDRWVDFRGAATTGDDSDAEPGRRRTDADMAADQPSRFEGFLDSISADQNPELWYHHSGLPHTPWTYLPDGRRYNGGQLYGAAAASDRWLDDQALVDNDLLRHGLQVELVDAMVGDLLDRLEQQDRLDDTMVIVTADHGASFLAGSPRRKLGEENLGAIAHVPLFVHMPGQNEGTVSDRRTQTIDIVPTIAEVLGVAAPPTPFDGVPLGEPVPDGRELQVVDVDTVLTVNGSLVDSSREAVDLTTGVLPEGVRASDVYVHPDLALQVPEVFSGTVIPAGVLTLTNFETLAAFDPDSDVVASLLLGLVAFAGGDDPTGQIVVRANGKLAGAGPVKPDGTAAIMLDPATFQKGSLTISAVFRAGGTNPWALLTISGDQSSSVSFDAQGIPEWVAVGDKSWPARIDTAGGSIDVVPEPDGPEDEGLLIGWSGDANRQRLPERVLLVVDGNVVGTPTDFISRPDVAAVLGSTELELAGWRFLIDGSDISDNLFVISLYEGGEFHVLTP